MCTWMPFVVIYLLITFSVHGAKTEQLRGMDISLSDSFMNTVFHYPYDYEYFLERIFGITVLHLSADEKLSSADNYTELINFNFDDILDCFAFMASTDATPTKDFIIENHGEQWKLIKRVVQDDGEYWTATFKNSSLSYKHVMGAIYQGGYSLYLIGLHHKVKKMETLANYIQSKMPDRKYLVSVNLYMTPQGGNQAFEVHMDYMDGLIFQVAGCKRWRIYDRESYPDDLQGIIPIKDNMIKPTQSQIDMMTFKEYELRKGDVLYVPKGILHEAATNCTLDHEEDITADNVQVKHKPKEPSVHLTIGIEDSSLMRGQRFDL